MSLRTPADPDKKRGGEAAQETLPVSPLDRDDSIPKQVTSKLLSQFIQDTVSFHYHTSTKKATSLDSN